MESHEREKNHRIYTYRDKLQGSIDQDGEDRGGGRNQDAEVREEAEAEGKADRREDNTEELNSSLSEMMR